MESSFQRNSKHNERKMQKKYINYFRFALIFLTEMTEKIVIRKQRMYEYANRLIYFKLIVVVNSFVNLRTLFMNKWSKVYRDSLKNINI